MTIRTRSQLDAALLRVFVEALTDQPFDDGEDADRSAPVDEQPDDEDREAAQPLAHPVLQTTA